MIQKPILLTKATDEFDTQSGYGTNIQISNFQTEFPSRNTEQGLFTLVRHLRIKPWLCLSLFIPALNYTRKLQLRKYSEHENGLT